MRLLSYLFLLLLAGFQTLPAQEIGEPISVEIAETSTTLNLDFSKCDYQLILYSIDTHLEDSSFGLKSPLGYSVTAAFGASNPVLSGGPDVSPQAPLSDRVSLESTLRERERELASRLQESGGYRPGAAKTVPQESGGIRKFAFPSFEGRPGVTITALLVATSERANAYVDLLDVGRMSNDSIKAQVDRFSETTYPIVTSAIGRPSDVDNDGKIHFLYTNRVNPDNSLFGSAAFFHAPSLLSVNQGGDGNQSDMFYIDPDTDPWRMHGLLAHEFQHLISFNQRVLLRNGQPEVLWLNEGLSHFCEDLIGENRAHNDWHVDLLLRNTSGGPLVTTSHAGQKTRGAAYLFVRSLVEEFGPGVLARLVQTDEAGLENIESATGDRFGRIFDRHVARLLLSGLGLNTKLNYTTAPLADDISQTRAFPLPHRALIWPGGGHQINDRGFTPVRRDDTQTVTIQGEMHQLSPAYIRLIGNRQQMKITIRTDPNGEFRAQLIPLPVNYQPQISISGNYWPRVAFDTPLPVQFWIGEAIPVSGRISNAALLGKVEFWFESGLRVIRLQTPITDGKFNKTLFFHPDEVGRYTFSITVAEWHGSAVFYPMEVSHREPPSPDFDRDGTVGFPDFILFARAFGNSRGHEDWESRFDLDLDGEVGFSDFLIFAQAFGQ
ncbi:MAG: hypothetical protein OYM47_08465 [Gemmatimonadota bacterium]|nr:hypothetical protein [Gemmatimonadota bacterium]